MATANDVPVEDLGGQGWLPPPGLVSALA